MLHWMANVVGAGGFWGVAALMAVENVVLPMPSELIMPLAGYDVARGVTSFWAAVFAGAAGSAIGALPMYAMARLLGRERVRGWIVRHGRWLLLSRRDLDRATSRFDERGSLAVFASQLFPGVRGLIALPAGFSRMNVGLFVATNFAGTLIWCVVLAYAGLELGPSFAKVDGILGPIGWAILGVLTIGIVVAIVWRRSR